MANVLYTGDAADLLGVPPELIEMWCAAKVIPHKRTKDGNYCFSERQLRSWSRKLSKL